MNCFSCSAEFEIEIKQETDKATEPEIEFCPFCGIKLGWKAENE